MLEHTRRLLERLLQHGENRPMAIPALWNTMRFDGDIARGRAGEIVVPARDFYAHLLARLMRAPAKRRPAAGAQGRVLYSMLPRMQSAWDARMDDDVAPGTLLRTICILPRLKALGVDTLYLLPICQAGMHYKKGALPSPYAVHDFFALDPALHDAALGPCTPQVLEETFAALVELCHHLGMDVMCDFVFRTCARDNVLMRAHPDWFYWIDLRAQHTFAPPRVPGVGENTSLNAKNAASVYKRADLRGYLSDFRPDPRSIDAARWREISGAEDLLGAIERAYGITTAPAFSDCMNDHQPLWTDVTYLRYDLGRNALAQAYVPEGTPPYVLFDNIKLNVVPPAVPNAALWELMADLIPSYIRRFDIDGARIDMGHALPKALLRRIVARARACKRDFLLWSEEFQTAKSVQARADGFDFISGPLWNGLAAWQNPYFNRRVLRAGSSVLPVVSALEMADTPRLAEQVPRREVRASLAVLSMLLPQSVCLLNSGMCIGEVQPMNLGLGKSEKGRYALHDDDPMQGRLAFFDVYRMHWCKERDICSEVAGATRLRRRWARVMDQAHFYPHPVMDGTNVWTAFAYVSGENVLLVAFNRGKRRASLRALGTLPPLGTLQNGEWHIAYYNGTFNLPCDAARLPMLAPGELIVLERRAPHTSNRRDEA